MIPEKKKLLLIATGGTIVVFDGKVIAGTRAKKVRSKSYNAFSSMDFPFLAVIQESRIIRYLPESACEEPVKFFTEMNDSIFLLKLIPGIRPEILPFIFERYDAIIIESFGVGGIPKAIREKVFYRKINYDVLFCRGTAEV